MDLNTRIKYEYVSLSKDEYLDDGSINWHHCPALKIKNEDSTVGEFLETLKANSDFKKGLSIVDIDYEVIEE